MAELVTELHQRRAAVLDESREAGVQKQHAAGKLTARERIACLFDEGSFTERGALAEPAHETRFTKDLVAPADAVVTGSGRIEGRTVSVASQDMMSLGASGGIVGGAKVEREASLCLSHGYPLVMVMEGGGHRIQEALDSRHIGSAPVNWARFDTLSLLSGWVPVVSAILGPGFAGPSNFAALSDFVVVNRNVSTMGIAGPALVKVATGEDLDQRELGGPELQVDRLGMADLACETDEEALAAIRRFLSFLPSNAQEVPPAADPADVSAPDGAGLLDIVPVEMRRAYDVHRVIEAIVDVGSIFELKPTYARNMVTTFARMNGRSVGVIANNPMHMAGTVDASAAEKGAHFVSLCDAFGLPIISLIDTPGVMVGPTAERSGLVRRMGRLLFEWGNASVPRLAVVLRKAYGAGYPIMGGGRAFDADMCVAWPTAEVVGMQVEGAVDIAFRRDIAGAPDPAAKREEIIADFRTQIGVYQAASGGGIDDVIDPRETRSALLEGLSRTARRKVRKMPPRFHAISPI